MAEVELFLYIAKDGKLVFMNGVSSVLITRIIFRKWA